VLRGAPGAEPLGSGAVACVVAVDAGTSGVRALALDEIGAVADVAYRELSSSYPRPGWVEQDPARIWALTLETLGELAGRLEAAGHRVAAVGITNQRETTVAWERRHGRPLAPAIVWQDRRTAGRCQALREAGHLARVRARTGLVLDPYFSATKMAWLLDEGGLGAGADRASLALGTVDSWLVWNLTGGPAGGVLATDPTNASRTLLYDIVARSWSAELAELFGVPIDALAEVRPTAGRVGRVEPGSGAPGWLVGVPISAMAGDQQAALFGQACFEPGMVKVTYGTGSFALTNLGPRCPAPPEGLLVSVGWDLGEHAGRSEPVAYALEGSTFVSGAAIQWLRDGLGLIARAEELEPLAASVDDSGGVTVVPAFTGLGSPWWDAEARGTITGLTRGSGPAQLARAVVEAMAFQVRDMTDAMGRVLGRPVSALRADGGAAVMDLLLQLQADQVQAPVARPVAVESTALGAATLAGLAEGVWGSLEELAGLWRLDREFVPAVPAELADAAYARWLAALERARGWGGG